MNPYEIYMDLFEESSLIKGMNLSMQFYVFENDDTQKYKVEESTPSSRGWIQSTRKYNYTSDKDVAWALAWDNITLDAMVGNDQTDTKYWNKI